MTYTEAIRKALSGDASGFEYLYNSTRNNKYYLALKYVKNEETTKDVLQEAYLRAWKSLDKLKEPEKFESWLAQIVVNTAKNELEKRNHTPLDLRAESGEDEDDTEIIDRAVSSWDNVPELEYTKEETRQLVHELIDALPDEQRLVLIAFELEGLTTKEIAEQLGCQEATIKSRLRYARGNIKKQAEVLQKKGYKLYSIAPVTMVLYLLRKDMVVSAAEPATQLALSECGKTILKNTHVAPQAVKAVGDTASAAKNTASVAKKIAFLSTKAGKTVATVVLTAAVGGTAVGVIHHNNTVATDTVVQSEESIADSVLETMEAAENVTEPETTVETEDTVETGTTETETAETETAETETTEAETHEEATPTPAADLPGINRNGRYADIPESVLPSSVAAKAEFVDEPIYGKPWPDVTGKIYEDYMRTQVLKVAEYGVDDFYVIAFCAEDEANGLYGNMIVIYNDQYAVINEVAFAIWMNGIDPEFN